MFKTHYLVTGDTAKKVTYLVFAFIRLRIKTILYLITRRIMTLRKGKKGAMGIVRKFYIAKVAKSFLLEVKQ